MFNLIKQTTLLSRCGQFKRGCNGYFYCYKPVLKVHSLHPTCQTRGASLIFKRRCFASVQQNCILSHCQFAEHFFHVKAIYHEQFYERVWGRLEFAFFVLKYPTKE